LIITLLTAIIAAIVGAATWQLILHTFALVRSHLLDPKDSQVFQTVSGMVLTVLIAMEFKHSLLIVLHQQREYRSDPLGCSDCSACNGSQVHHPRHLSDTAHCSRRPRYGLSIARHRVLTGAQ
jgi:hypothetical protein